MKRTDRFAFQIDLFVGLVRAARVNLAGWDNEEMLAHSAPALTSRDDGSGTRRCIDDNRATRSASNLDCNYKGRSSLINAAYF